MRQAGLPVLLAIAWLCVAGPALAVEPSAEPGASTRAPLGDVRLVTLKNGMQLVLAPDSLSATVDVAVWFRAGSTHERPGITGISHFFEHLMFRGSEHFGVEEHSRLVAAEGGTSNAYTAPDYACYYQTIPPAALDLVFRLEADRIASLRLTSESVAAERRVVDEERRWRGELGPLPRAVQDLEALAWSGEPYAWPVIGLEQDVQRISLADCRKYFEDHYAPNNAVVTVVGGFDVEQVLASARHWLEPLKRRAVAGLAAVPSRAQAGERRSAERMDVPLPVLLVGWKIPGRADPDAAAFDVLARVLAGAPDARLQRALVAEKSKCWSVQSAEDGRRGSGLLYVLAAVRSLADTAEIERTLVQKVEELASQPVSEDELARARRQEEIATLLAWQTPHGRAEAIGTGLMLADDARSAAARLERVRALTPADLRRAAARAFQASGRSVLWVMPQNGAATPGGGTDGPGADSPLPGGGR